VLDKGMLVRLRRKKAGWREVEIGCGAWMRPAPSTRSELG